MTDKAFDPFIKLNHSLLNSQAYRKLTPNSKALFIELVKCYNGNNNGFIEYSYRQASCELCIGINQAKAAFDQLRQHGFIVMTFKGQRITPFQRIKSRWEITCYPMSLTDGKKRMGTCDYLNWSDDHVEYEGVMDFKDIPKKTRKRKSRAKPKEVEYEDMGVKVIDDPYKDIAQSDYLKYEEEDCCIPF